MDGYAVNGTRRPQAENTILPPAKSLFAVDYPTPPYAQRSLIPRAKGSNGQLREASFEKITTSKQGHVAFLQKPPQDLRLDTLPEKGEGKSKISGASPLTPTRDKSDSQWIHRDKLAQIERQELREMESRLDELESGDVQASAGMKDTLISGGNDGHTVEAEEPISKRQRVDSPLNHEMGSREGLTPAVSSSMGYSTPTKTIDVRKDSRTGSSRIPVARSSPVAYSNSPERLTPGQTRVRLVPNPNGSIQYSKPRDRRVGDAVSPGGSSVRPLSATFTPSPLSVSGQTLPSADDVPVAKTRPPSRGPSGTQSRQGSVSRNTSNAKKRLSPGPVNGISPRPGSSSGTRRTRGPINRPEGEAPWIADMYKPDPMIPPDEQIVPTHAKLLGLHLKDAADGSSQDEAEPTAPQDFVDTPTKAIFGSETIPEVDRFEELEVEHKVNGGKDMYPTFLAWTDGSLRSKPIEPVVGGDQTLAGIQEIPQADLRLPLRSDTPTATAQVSEQRDRSRSRSRSRVRAEAILPLVSATTPQPENLKLSSPRALVSRPSVEQPHGGYKIMPTVRSPAQMEEDLLRHPVLRGTSPTRAASRQSTTAQSSQPVRQDSRINTTLAKPQQVLPSPTPVKAAKPIRAMNMEEPANEKSDGEDNAPPSPPAEVEVDASAAPAAAGGQMSVLDALKGVLKLALIHDGLARGLREASKALDRRQAHMCVLNEACEEEAYKKLVVALCGEHKIPLIKVPDGKQLGEWAGLCQIDREGNARKVVNCSCVVVKDWGEESQERSVLLNYFQTEQ